MTRGSGDGIVFLLDSAGSDPRLPCRLDGVVAVPPFCKTRSLRTTRRGRQPTWRNRYRWDPAPQTAQCLGGERARPGRGGRPWRRTPSPRPEPRGPAPEPRTPRTAPPGGRPERGRAAPLASLGPARTQWSSPAGPLARPGEPRLTSAAGHTSAPWAASRGAPWPRQHREPIARGVPPQPPRTRRRTRCPPPPLPPARRPQGAPPLHCARVAGTPRPVLPPAGPRLGLWGSSLPSFRQPLWSSVG